MADKGVSVKIDLGVAEALETDVGKAALLKPAKVIGDIVSGLLALPKCAVLALAFLPEWAIILMEGKLRYIAERTNKILEEIPEEERVEPDVGAIHAVWDEVTKSCDTPEHREMFANLLAWASTKKGQHEVLMLPSFADVAKKLTPLDAVVLKTLNRKRSTSKDIIKTLTKDTLDVIGIYGSSRLRITITRLTTLGVINKPYGYPNTWVIAANEDQENEILASELIEYHSLTDYGSLFTQVCLPPTDQPKT